RAALVGEQAERTLRSGCLERRVQHAVENAVDDRSRSEHTQALEHHRHATQRAGLGGGLLVVQQEEQLGALLAEQDPIAVLETMLRDRLAVDRRLRAGLERLKDEMLPFPHDLRVAWRDTATPEPEIALRVAAERIRFLLDRNRIRSGRRDLQGCPNQSDAPPSVSGTVRGPRGLCSRKYGGQVS